MFLADSPGLDFLNSIATPVDVPVDWIADGAGLLDWLIQAHMVPDDVAAHLRAGAAPGELDAIAGKARALREWFREFVQAHRGRPLRTADETSLEPINRLLVRDHIYLRLIPGKGESSAAAASFVLTPSRRWDTPEALLYPIAEALARTVSEEDFSHVKACEGPACTLLFADHTRGHRRRWCSMAVCGNRAKQLAHYHRHHG
jgi:predicted RNA-binding Zn ribbon-like protein